MKEKLIKEISNAMTEVLSMDQIVQLNSALLQIVSKYTITEDGEKLHVDSATNERLLEVFLSCKTDRGMYYTYYQVLRFNHQATF